MLYTVCMASPRRPNFLHLLLIAVMVLGIIAVLALVFAISSSLTSGTTSTSPQADANAPIPQPAYTDAVAAQLAASQGFQEVISYTDHGFEPATLPIQKGDAVRFTNNSHEGLWVAAVPGAGAYPGGDTSCGTSALDSCHILQPGEFWEFTFDVTGTWVYLNNVDKANTGTVYVQ